MKNRKRSFIKISFAAVAFCLVLTDCQTTKKDIVLSSADEKSFAGLDAIEETIITLDGAGADREGIARARLQIAALEGTAAGNEFEARLAAWSGRLYLMEGRNSDAQKEYQNSENLSPLNLASRILAFRLERDLPKRLSMIDQSLETSGPLGELLAERGRVLFDLSRFSESAAAFDAAFDALREKPYYREAYGTFRNKAWELSEPGQGNFAPEIAYNREITWRELIEITRNETELLRFITGSRNLPVETLFIQLLDRSFIPITQDVTRTEWPFSNPASSEIVLRSGAAWFLWRLNAETWGNRGLLTQYSSRYANTPSPISDLDNQSPFLDSILGCVEWGFMFLPDGKNFMPNERIRGQEFLSLLKKL